MANDFKVFAGASTNITSQVDYVASAVRTAGVASGTASSALANKSWRQSSIIAAMIGDFIFNNSAQDAIDDGTTATLLTNFQTAVQNAVVAVAGQPRYLNKSADYTALAADAGATINFTAGATLSLTAAATVGNGWACTVRNSSASGYVTIDPNGAETIDGNSTCAVPPGGDLQIRCNGSAFFTFGWRPRTLVYDGTPSGSSWSFSVPIAFAQYVNSFDIDWRGVYLSGNDRLAVQIGSGTDGSPSWVTSGYAGESIFSYGSGGSGDDNTLYPHGTNGCVVGMNASGSNRGYGTIVARRQASDYWLLTGQSGTEANHVMTYSGVNTVSGLTRFRIVPHSSATFSGGNIRVYASV